MAIKLSRNILIKYWYCFSTLNLSCKTKTQFATYQLGLICLHNKATKNQLFSLHLFQIGYQHYSLHNWKYFFNVFWKIKALSTISKLNLTFSTLNLSCKTKTQFATYQLGLICLHNRATKISSSLFICFKLDINTIVYTTENIFLMSFER